MTVDVARVQNNNKQPVFLNDQFEPFIALIAFNQNYDRFFILIHKKKGLRNITMRMLTVGLKKAVMDSDAKGSSTPSTGSTLQGSLHSTW